MPEVISYPPDLCSPPPCLSDGLKQTNPGSTGHPHNCRACNKYLPGRPGSCKHGELCDFCHEGHDRPKHRGQRGRHAVQRRQFFVEDRAEMPEEERELIESIYEIPSGVFAEVKKIAQGLDKQERSQKLREVVDKVQAIGDEAQQSRPDSCKRQARESSVLLDVPPMTELDGRVKWLIGTLHLMLRKQKEAGKTLEERKATVGGLLAQCQKLPELLYADHATRLALEELKQKIAALFDEAFKTEGQDQQHETSWLQEKLLSLLHPACEALADMLLLEEIITSAAVLFVRGSSDQLREKVKDSFSLEQVKEAVTICMLQDVKENLGDEDGEADQWDDLLPEHCLFIAEKVKDLVIKAEGEGIAETTVKEGLGKVQQACTKLDIRIRAILAPGPGKLKLSREEVEMLIIKQLNHCTSLEDLAGQMLRALAVWETP